MIFKTLYVSLSAIKTLFCINLALMNVKVLCVSLLQIKTLFDINLALMTFKVLCVSLSTIKNIFDIKSRFYNLQGAVCVSIINKERTVIISSFL